MVQIYERKYPCPCSRSTVTTTTTEDPMTGTTTTYHMDCILCDRAYQIMQLSARRIHKFQSPFSMYVRVVKKREAELYEKLYQEYHQLQTQLIVRSKQLYLPVFMTEVLSAEGKKGIWNKLQALAGEPTRTLRAFYRYTRKRIEEIVKSHFTLERLPQILKALQITDPEIEKTWSRMEQIHRQIHHLEEDMVKNAYRLEAGVTVH
ncbi:hypothetical protein [Deinococcus roseus]|uniref:Uncharacterized protein n=1 Tax=Deinococcus roseus TaxID=392414 RepID=A0ABQ2CXX6_9DEIO|nr:hypothetical protein [Deinococcus roseus]GGJ27602.1 hypothetical protein GCM10008938_12110 [Deinococcus roseus]